MNSLTSFPHISQAEFDEACTAFQRRFEQFKHAQESWVSVEAHPKYETTYLRVTKELPIKSRTVALNETEDEELEEPEDEEALPSIPLQASQVLVHYDVILSPTYRVPTLYIHIADPMHRFPPTLDTLYQHLVAPQYVSQIQDVGVLGGITIIDHPVENRPVFFIHPCRTAEVLEAAAGERQLCANDYLMLWLGAMGKCVGLDVPLVLASLESNHGEQGME